MKRLIFLCAGSLALAGGLVYWFAGGGEQPPVVEAPIPAGQTTAGSALPAPSTPEAAQMAAGYPTTHATESNQPSTGDKWFKLMAADDPYPAMMRLREARQPGSFAKALEIRNACLRADSALQREARNPLNPNNPNYAAHAKAKEALQTRCGRFFDESTYTMQPLADDKDGLKYMAALRLSSDIAVLKNTATFGTNMETLASQGRLDKAMGWLQMRLTWNGESWRDAPVAFQTAVRLAEIKATSEPSMAEQDIRLLAGCASSGYCLKNYDDVLLRLPENQRQRTLKTAEEMAEMLRNNDVQLFMNAGKKPS